MQPGTLLIPESDVYTMTVTKTGVVYPLYRRRHRRQ